MWFVSTPLEQAHTHLSNSLEQRLFKTQWKVVFQFRVIKRDFRLRRGAVTTLALLRCYAVRVGGWVTDVSRQCIGSVIMVQAAPDCWNIQDGTDSLSRNVVNKLITYTT